MPFLRRILLAPSIIALFFTLSFSTLEVRADPLAITGGSYSVSSPFQTIPRYISFGFDLQGNNFRAAGGEGDGATRQVGVNCASPCTTFNLSATNNLLTNRPTSVLQINGQNRFGWFRGSELTFSTDSVTIPLNAGQSLTLTASFTMSGVVSFEEFDLQRSALTGFTFNSAVFGSGIAEISLFFSQVTHQYEIGSVRYNFQPAAVPEPATLLLLGAGLAGAAARLRRRRTKD